jgi:hypothetical protein
MDTGWLEPNYQGFLLRKPIFTTALATIDDAAQ